MNTIQELGLRISRECEYERRLENENTRLWLGVIALSALNLFFAVLCVVLLCRI